MREEGKERREDGREERNLENSKVSGKGVGGEGKREGRRVKERQLTWLTCPCYGKNLHSTRHTQHYQ